MVKKTVCCQTKYMSYPFCAKSHFCLPDISRKLPLIRSVEVRELVMDKCANIMNFVERSLRVLQDFKDAL